MEKAKSIVWKQFKNRKIGYLSLIVVVIMFGIAIFAPFIANDKPIYIYSRFPSLYNYYYLSATRNLDVLMSAAGKEEELRELEAYYIEGFNKQRDIIAELNSRLVEVGNEYDAVISQIYSLESRIERLRSRGVTNLEAEYIKMQELEQERNEIGGVKNQIQAEIIRETNIQNYDYNQPLLEVRFKLDTKRSLNNLRKALISMNTLVSPDLGASIEEMIIKIENISPENPDLEPLNDMYYGLTLLSLDSIRDKLEYKGIFPVFGALSLIDIFLMMVYMNIVFILIIGPHYIFNIKRMLISLVIILMIAFILFHIIPKLPEQNYKILMKNNIDDGYTSTYALFPPIPFGLNENHFNESYQPPMFFETDGMRSRHILGTDDNGRSIITRLIWGSRVSLSVGFVSVSILVVLGIIIGSIAGYYGRWIDIIISRVIEVVMCFPAFFLILAVIAFVGPSIYYIMLVIGFTGWTGIARLVRGEFLRIKNLDYVQAGRALGASAPRSMIMHILPNALTPVLVSAAFGFASAILYEASLSFLGFGVQDPIPSWGQMLSASKGHPLLYWWMFITPGFALFITVTLYNLIGNTLRDAIDPRLRM